MLTVIDQEFPTVYPATTPADWFILQ